MTVKDSWKKAGFISLGIAQCGIETGTQKIEIAIFNNQMTVDQKLQHGLVVRLYSCVVLYQY